MPRSRVTRRWGLLAVLATGPLSQLGHILGYVFHYGPASWPRQGLGAHAYFPVVAKTSAGLVGLLVLATLAAIGLARLLRARRSAPGTLPRPAPLGELIAVLVPLQVAIFVAQETVELTLAGQLNGVGDVPILWGLAGQLPVACLAALFLHWGSIAVPSAMRRLSLWLEPIAAAPPLPALVAAPAAHALPLATSVERSMARRKRGPPLRSRPT